MINSSTISSIHDIECMCVLLVTRHPKKAPRSSLWNHVRWGPVVRRLQQRTDGVAVPFFAKCYRRGRRAQTAIKHLLFRLYNHVSSNKAILVKHPNRHSTIYFDDVDNLRNRLPQNTPTIVTDIAVLCRSLFDSGKPVCSRSIDHLFLLFSTLCLIDTE